MTHARLTFVVPVVASLLTASALATAFDIEPGQGTSSAAAQQISPPAPAPSQPQTTQTRPTPPYSKPLAAATGLKEPEQKIEALRKVIADFPKTPAVDQANREILNTLMAMGEPAGARIREQAERIVAAAAPAVRTNTLRTVANNLLTGGVLLDLAEQYAKTALDSLDQASYLDARKKEYGDRVAQAEERAKSGATAARMPPFDEQAAITRFKNDRQASLVTYGQVVAKRGRAAEAEKALSEAYMLAPKSAAAATAALRLAEFAKAAGQSDRQFEYLSAVALAGRLTPANRGEMEAVYRKLHGGSLSGLMERLDGRYEKESPNPVEVKPYEPAANRSDRLVLAEVFTGSGCPPCVGADLAFEAAMERYRPQDLAVLMYHLHIPRPDPMTNPWTLERERFYKIRGVPTYFIDGETDGAGGGGAEAAPRIYKDRVVPAVDKHLALKADTKLTLQASFADGIVTVRAQAGAPSPEAGHLKLQIALVEHLVRYSGENAVRFHPMVVRSLASKTTPTTESAPARAVAAEPESGAATTVAVERARSDEPNVLGFAIDPAAGLNVEYAFDLKRIAADAKAHLDDFELHSARFGKFEFMEKKHEIDQSNLAVVAFVQDESSRKVLQTAYIDLCTKAASGGPK